VIETRSARLAVLALLLAALVAALVGFGTLTPNPADGRYPGTDAVASDPAQYHGDQVVVGGTVVGTDPIVLEAGYETVRDGGFARGTVRFTVTGVATAVDRGDSLQVFGTLGQDRSIAADETVVSSPDGDAYMYAVSFLAGLWVLARLTRQWRIDWKRLAVVPRHPTEDSHTDPTADVSRPETEREE
jgi:hypothetical protein